uniref:Uncharacterized protein n=1 Tax=Ascaris lumbricoides TaxID=6252 RepID=A0A0M3IUY4_ASCLU
MITPLQEADLNPAEPQVETRTGRLLSMLKTAQRLWSCSSRLKVNDEIPLVVYHSLRSKLRVVIADVPGPTVKGILSFGIESDLLNNDVVTLFFA